MSNGAKIALALVAGAGVFAGIVMLVPQRDGPGVTDGPQDVAEEAALATEAEEAEAGDAVAAEAAAEEPAETEADVESEAAVVAAPQVDTLRVEPDGMTVVAGRAAAGATVAVVIGGEVLAEVVADGTGAFVAMLDLPPSDQPRALSVVTDPAGAAVESEGTFLVAPTAPAEVEVAALTEDAAAEDAPAAVADGEVAAQEDAAEADAAVAEVADPAEAAGDETAEALATPVEHAGAQAAEDVVGAEAETGEAVAAETGAAPAAEDGDVAGEVAVTETAALAEDAAAGVAPDAAVSETGEAAAETGEAVAGETQDTETASAEALAEAVPEVVEPVTPDATEEAVALAEESVTPEGVAEAVPTEAEVTAAVETEPAAAEVAATGAEAPSEIATAGAETPGASEDDVSLAEETAAPEAGDVVAAVIGGDAAETVSGTDAPGVTETEGAVADVAGAETPGAETPGVVAVVEEAVTEAVSPGVSAAEELALAETPGAEAPEVVPVVVDEAPGLVSPVAEEVAAPPVLVSDAEGVRVVQPSLAPGAGPEVLRTVAVDAISYDAEGAVDLSGRAAGGGTVRIYVDNAPIADIAVDPDGQWKADLTALEPGVYTLRVDQLDETGAVTSRMETPFLREDRADIAAAMAEETAAEGFEVAVQTVQPGNTLWAIARDRYGDGVLYVQVFEANRDRIRNPDLIYPGQIFVLPEDIGAP